ncbi:hypothetical protein J3R04_001693 [Spirilliplanes yamanashiensis]|nr:hypothetical protein [Spirilliplanes yamanashiensis]
MLLLTAGTALIGAAAVAGRGSAGSTPAADGAGRGPHG